MSLANAAVIVKLSIGQWSARKLSKKGTQEIAAAHGTTDKWARANKSLVSKDALSAIAELCTSARTWHYEHTLPWDDSGARLLPTAMYTKYMDHMRSARTTFESLVDRFISAYPDLIDEAKLYLNGLFEASDYPSPAEIASRFSMSVEVLPVPQGSDIRVTITGAEEARIRAEVDAAANKRLGDACRDLYNRLYDAVKHVHEKLTAEGSIFRDSLIGNIQELVEILPALNVTGDAALDRLTQEARAIAAYDPNRLRKDGGARAIVASEAARIVSAMKGMM